MIATTRPQIFLVDNETQALLDWTAQVQHSDETIFHKAQTLATRLGAHYRSDGLTQIGFWAPELGADMIQPKNIYLEILTPKSQIDPRLPLQTARFRKDYVQLEKQGEYFWGVIAGMRPGTKDQMGSFYWLQYLDMNTNEVRIIGDCLAYSLPYGVYAPAELYDMDSLQHHRGDRPYFGQGDANEAGIIHVHPPRNILQLHINTASPDGTLAGLTRTYQQISDKLAAQESLTPAEESFIGYDAVQLLPIEPIVEYRADHDIGQGFFNISEDDLNSMDPDTEGVDHEEGDIRVTLKKPNTQNWGYDIVIFSSSATNPAVLETLRPDELIEFISTLHNFSTGPIQVIYDIVYGHADNQAIDLLNGRFLKGPNMYGQDVNHQNPTVRAILLEMQRRKSNSGIDGIRVDGAQDFKFFNPFSGRVEYDDQYLSEMADVIQEIGGHKRQLFSIFEDGRPWPAEGWEEISTYRDIIAFKPDCFQWGPLIFAHNTPSIKKFWDKKWQRVCEVMQIGENWITGCGNHDTLRRGTQVDTSLPINWNLGETLPDVLHNAYDNPAIMLWVYGFSPGLPMDFINCTMRAPWGFLRNTDDRYGVKVVAEEAGGFLDWQITPDIYKMADVFPRLKALGFTKLGELRQFMEGLYDAIEETNYDLEEVAQICQRNLGSDVETESVKEESKQRRSAAKLQKLNVPDKSQVLTELDVGKLKEIARNFMEDAHDIANVWRHTAKLNSDKTAYNLQLRRFRHINPWLMANLSGLDRFNRVSDDDTTIFYGLRSEPTEDEGDRPLKHIAMVANMGGEPMTVTLGDWLQIDWSEWSVAIASPGLDVGNTPEDWRAFELKDSQAVLFEKIE
ncbi:MAG: glucosylglycerol hydrolase [Elainellaceae cyanobacterium]